MSYLPTPLPQHLDVHGLGIEMDIVGQGRPLVYLHAGDGADREAPFIDELSRHFSVFLPSHPGFGLSDLPREFNAIDDLAYFYLDFLEQQNLRDVMLVGSSFGGWLAAEIAIRNTSRIGALVLAAPLGIKIDGREQRGITDIFSLTPAELTAHVRAHGKQEVPDYREVPEEIVTRIARNREALTLFGWSPTLYNPRLQYWLHRVDVPTLVLWGDSDKIVPVAYGDAFCQEIAGAELSIIEDAGHYLPYDKPHEFATSIVEFATRNGDFA